LIAWNRRVWKNLRVYKQVISIHQVFYRTIRIINLGIYFCGKPKSRYSTLKIDLPDDRKHDVVGKKLTEIVMPFSNTLGKITGFNFIGGGFCLFPSFPVKFFRTTTSKPVVFSSVFYCNELQWLVISRSHFNVQFCIDFFYVLYSVSSRWTSTTYLMFIGPCNILIVE